MRPNNLRDLDPERAGLHCSRCEWEGTSIYGPSTSSLLHTHFLDLYSFIRLSIHSLTMLFSFYFKLCIRTSFAGGNYGGACVQCCHKECLTAFHPYCAFTSKYTMVAPVDSGGYATYQIYCRKHDPSAAVGVMRNSREQCTRKNKIQIANVESGGGKLGCRPPTFSSPSIRSDSPSCWLVDTAIKGPRSRPSLPKRTRCVFADFIGGTCSHKMSVVN